MPKPGKAADRARACRATAYWNEKSGTASFTHPFDLAAFGALVPRDARVLDLGCGYGRTVKELGDAGFVRVRGLDVSPDMVARGRREFPGLDLGVWDPGPLPLADGTADAVILFAVLTCIPDDKDQRQLVEEIRRVLAPGGILYISDYPLQEDERNQARYAESESRGLPRGVFRLPDGGTFRHHAREWIADLFSSFAVVSERLLDVKTFKGHNAQAFQLLLKKQV